MAAQDRTRITHYYAFYTRADDPIPFYVCTFGSEEEAGSWVQTSPDNRFVIVDKLPDKYWY